MTSADSLTIETSSSVNHANGENGNFIACMGLTGRVGPLVEHMDIMSY